MTATDGHKFEFMCEYCGWEGTEPTLDAHFHTFCPRCGKPADFKEVIQARKRA